MNEVVLTNKSEPIKSLLTVICMSRLDFHFKYCYCVMQSVQYIKLYRNAAGRLLLILMSIFFMTRQITKLHETYFHSHITSLICRIKQLRTVSYIFNIC